MRHRLIPDEPLPCVISAFTPAASCGRKSRTPGRFLESRFALQESHMKRWHEQQGRCLPSVPLQTHAVLLMHTLTSCMVRLQNYRFDPQSCLSGFLLLFFLIVQ